VELRVGINRANKLKNKKRSCEMCKPHKTGHVNRWKKPYQQELKKSSKEIINKGGGEND
jgi:hypothetical protein